jgi:hypothetical protein
MTCIVTCLIWGFLYSGEAQAWTDAKIQNLETRIALVERDPAEVAMKITIVVRSGWLSSFEITGLDDDMVLDEKRPPTLVSETGANYYPEIKTLSPGCVVLVFSNQHEAPGRGSYAFDLFYKTRLLSRSSRVNQSNTLQVQWTLPPWQVGIDDVRIEVTAPKGARPIALSSDVPFSEERTFSDKDNGTTLSWHRFRLPKTVAWAIGFTLPQGSFASASISPVEPKPRDAKPEASASSSNAWVAILIGFVALLKRHLVTTDCKKRRIEPVPLIPLKSAFSRNLLIFLLTVVSGFIFDNHRNLALAQLCLLVALSVDRDFRRQPIRAQGAWTRVAERDLERVRLYPIKSLFGYRSWLDATTPLGLALLFSVYTLIVLLFWRGDHDLAYHWTFGAILLTPLFVTGTRKNLPLPPEADIRILTDFAKKSNLDTLLKPDVRYGIFVYKSPLNDWYEARLRFYSDNFTDGLHLFDLVVANPLGHRGVSARCALLSVSSTGSAADTALKTALKDTPTCSSYNDERVARMTYFSNAATDIRELLELPVKASPKTS